MPRDVDYSYTNANTLDGKFTYSSSTSKTRYTTALVSYSDPANGMPTQWNLYSSRIWCTLWL
jgi:predicted phage tail protein